MSISRILCVASVVMAASPAWAAWRSLTPEEYAAKTVAQPSPDLRFIDYSTEQAGAPRTIFGPGDGAWLTLRLDRKTGQRQLMLHQRFSTLDRRISEADERISFGDTALDDHAAVSDTAVYACHPGMVSNYAYTPPGCSARATFHYAVPIEVVEAAIERYRKGDHRNFPYVISIPGVRTLKGDVPSAEFVGLFQAVDASAPPPQTGGG